MIFQCIFHKQRYYQTVWETFYQHRNVKLNRDVSTFSSQLLHVVIQIDFPVVRALSLAVFPTHPSQRSLSAGRIVPHLCLPGKHANRTRPHTDTHTHPFPAPSPLLLPPSYTKLTKHTQKILLPRELFLTSARVPLTARRAALFGGGESRDGFEPLQVHNETPSGRISSRAEGSVCVRLCACVHVVSEEGSNSQGFNQIISSSTLFSTVPSTLLGEKREHISVQRPHTATFCEGGQSEPTAWLKQRRELLEQPTKSCSCV